MRLIHVGILLTMWAAFPMAASARGWQGIIPGTTTESEVVAKFGSPSTQGKLSGRVALVFKGEQVITGTRQAQIFLREGSVVDEVVVFPSNPLDKDSVLGTYGQPTKKAFTDDFKTVWYFRTQGITVFFGKDGSVDAISFRAPEKDARSTPSKATTKPTTVSVPPPAQSKPQQPAQQSEAAGR